ncbi:MAG: alpha/beta hydrolase, partial [Microcoleaceae cyanobacterium]
MYKSLPFVWEAETQKNDSDWLESIVRNSAPFSDWWTKARIIQLAYPAPPNYIQPATNIPTYAGYQTESMIVQALQSLCDPEEYPDFCQYLTEAYVIRALNSWHTNQFTQAIGRNFEIYADRQNSNVFLLTSTASIYLNVDRELPPVERFRPLFNVDELARIIWEIGCDRLTCRVHGYATSGKQFYETFTKEATELNQEVSPQPGLTPQHFYIGYHWPSEKPLFFPAIFSEIKQNKEIVLKFLITLTSLSLLAGTVFFIALKFALLPLFSFFNKLPGLDFFINDQWLSHLSIITWMGTFITVFFLWLVIICGFRVLVYLRDRDRVINYGAPDLAEFFWRLDRAIDVQRQRNAGVAIMPWMVSTSNINETNDLTNSSNKNSLNESSSDQTQNVISEQPVSSYPKIPVNFLGNSLGCLLIVNILRILSDKYGKDERIEREKGDIGDYLILDKLILSSPDLPLEFLRESRNNYVRSAILRCQQIYLLSSDRDIVLRYVSNLGNWFTEPNLAMSGMRLGNVYLKSVNSKNHNFKQYIPSIRILFTSLPATTPTSAYDLFEKFNYLDCSEMPGLNGVPWPLKKFNSWLIDLLNTVLFIANKIDVHGAYFWVKTPSFQIIKILLTNNRLS